MNTVTKIASAADLANVDAEDMGSIMPMSAEERREAEREAEATARAAREAELQAELAANRDVYVERAAKTPRSRVLSAVAAVLVKRDVPVVLSWHCYVGGDGINCSPRLSVRGIDIGHFLSVDPMRRHVSPWRSEATGKYRVTVGDFGNKTMFPPRKDDTHNYEGIADKVDAYASRMVAQRDMSAVQANNVAGVETLRQYLKLANWGTMQLSPSASADKPVFVKVEIKQAMTQAQAIALHAALVGLGIVVAKEG